MPDLCCRDVESAEFVVAQKKHAVLQHDLKKNRISILSSKFEVFEVGDINREAMPNLENNVKFEKIIIFDTHIRHI